MVCNVRLKMIKPRRFHPSHSFLTEIGIGLMEEVISQLAFFNLLPFFCRPLKMSNFKASAKLIKHKEKYEIVHLIYYYIDIDSSNKYYISRNNPSTMTIRNKVNLSEENL